MIEHLSAPDPCVEAWRRDLLDRLDEGAGSAPGSAWRAEVAQAVARYLVETRGDGAWREDEIDRLLVHACVAAGEEPAARAWAERRCAAEPARARDWLREGRVAWPGSPVGPALRAGLVRAAAGPGGAGALWRVDLAGFAWEAGGVLELGVWPRLARWIDALAPLAVAGERPARIGLGGAAALARAMEGPRAPAKRVRARCAELRSFCARRFARAADRRGEPAPEVVLADLRP